MNAKTPYKHQQNENIVKNYEILKALGLDNGAKAKVLDRWSGRSGGRRRKLWRVRVNLYDDLTEFRTGK